MKKGAEASRRRNPLSDCTNFSNNISSSAFHKSVAKCATSLPPFKTSPPPGTVDLELSEQISVFCSRIRASNERKKNKRKKAVANPPVTEPCPKISNIRGNRDEVEGLDLPEAKQPCRKKQHAVPSKQDKFKNAQLQDYIEKQIAYFKEIDEFNLSEVEVESTDELE